MKLLLFTTTLLCGHNDVVASAGQRRGRAYKRRANEFSTLQDLGNTKTEDPDTVVPGISECSLAHEGCGKNADTESHSSYLPGHETLNNMTENDFLNATAEKQSSLIEPTLDSIPSEEPSYELQGPDLVPSVSPDQPNRTTVDVSNLTIADNQNETTTATAGQQSSSLIEAPERPTQDSVLSGEPSYELPGPDLAPSESRVNHDALPADQPNTTTIGTTNFIIADNQNKTTTSMTQAPVSSEESSTCYHKKSNSMSIDGCQNGTCIMARDENETAAAIQPTPAESPASHQQTKSTAPKSSRPKPQRTRFSMVSPTVAPSRSPTSRRKKPKRTSFSTASPTRSTTTPQPTDFPTTPPTAPTSTSSRSSISPTRYPQEAVELNEKEVEETN